jgi:hypothetical protein
MTAKLFLRKQHDRLHTHDDDHDDMGGLHRDLASTGTAIGRGEFLCYTVGAGALALFGCGGSLGDVTSSTPGTDAGATTGTGGACSKVPEETAGPYPGDGSNGANVLNQTGVVRQDIRSSFAGLSDRPPGFRSRSADPRVGVDLHAARQSRRLPLALRRARQVSFTSSFPAATPAGGRTSTSRSIRAWRRRRRCRTRSRRRSSSTAPPSSWRL